MAENLAQARQKLDGQRKAVRAHVKKWQEHKEPYEKNVAWKTIQNAQGHIAKIKSDHPTLKNDNDRADSWRPGESI